ncbi:EAL domain-containing protein [Nocardioides rubriscoriae]|uniref:EAL domain-containing protein n=1 Tax=Nocardioides rubriscoriae TaxID=642762 RepID=UPI0011E05ED3|nr:EAL domain-containing protein [Nocardioides rubriscoriae]
MTAPLPVPGDSGDVSSAKVTLGLAEHDADLPTTTSLITAIAEMRGELSLDRQALVLLAATVSNAAEIADVHGAHALEVVSAQVARRTLQHDTLRVQLLRASPLGGFLAAVVVDRDLARAQVDELLSDVRRLVGLTDDQVWPVVTVGACECDDDDIGAVIRDVRSSVVAAGRESPGATRWRAGVSAPGVVDDLGRARDLALAIESHAAHPDQLHLHYQPLHDLRSGRVVGAEALLRWDHPERGSISPMLTVEAAERTGLIVPLGRLVLSLALGQVAEWRGRLDPDFRIHVNVSPLELREPSYVDAVEAALIRAGVAPSQLVLEVIETALLADEPSVYTTLFALRDLGVGLSIDDFGTGYSSIAHLHRLPIDTVKVDRSLISGVADESSDFMLTRAVLGLVATLGVMVVAEGIETALEAAHLRSMGCHFGQGYHLGRPVPPAQFLPAPPSRARSVSSTATA